MPAPKHLQTRLNELPDNPGVYLYKNDSGHIIYVGKASILKRRVRSYFTKKHTDIKTPILVKNIASIDWIVTESEVEALFLEAELIKRYKPLYNVRDKDDKNFSYVKVTMQEDFPKVTVVRRPADPSVGPLARRCLQELHPFSPHPGPGILARTRRHFPRPLFRRSSVRRPVHRSSPSPFHRYRI